MAFAGFALAVSSLGVQIHQGEQQRQEAKKSRKETTLAQKQSQGQALRQERQNVQAQRRANRDQPDVSAFLGSLDKKPATALSGSAGVSPDSLLLSRVTPLGVTA